MLAQIEESEATKIQDSIKNQTVKTQKAIEPVKDVALVPTQVPGKGEEENKSNVPECVSGDCKEGDGMMKYQSGTYVGQWQEGLRYGQGKFTWNNGDTYDGSWFEDKRHGQGIYIWHDGSKYKGHYSHGVRSGYGIYYYKNGTIYEGTWQSNLKHGIANFYYDGSVNIGGRYINNEYVDGTGITQETYKYKPQ